MLAANGMQEASELLQKSANHVVETDYDNWNGGTTIWTIYLSLEPRQHAQLGTRRVTIEAQIDEQLKAVLERFTRDWFNTKIVPAIVGKPKQISINHAISRARTTADTLDANWMKTEIERMQNSIETDPALAIGTAKDFIETCCKSILSERGVTVAANIKMPALIKQLFEKLNLVPAGISNEVKGAETIKQLSGNLAAISRYLAELRGDYGSGHGRDGKHRGLEERHARLAIGAAVTFVDFVVATHKKRA